MTERMNELITRVISGMATQDETTELLKWVESAEENKLLFASMKNAGNLAVMSEYLKDSELLNERYREFIRLRGEIKDGLSIGQGFMGKSLVISLRRLAASIILIVGISVSTGYLLFHKPFEEPSMNQLVVPSGQQAQLTLSDGTRIWLNARSRLIYPGNFTGRTREVLLDGEAFFEVMPNSDKPFVVKSDLLAVKVLGTSFNFSAYKDDKELKMTLVEGSISIIGEHKNEITRLKPSQTGVYSKSKKTLFISSEDTELYTSWRNGQFKFRRMHFEDISRRLSRNFNVDFVIQKENLKKVTFSGSFHKYESLDQILRAFQHNYPFQYKINKNQVIIN